MTTREAANRKNRKTKRASYKKPIKNGLAMAQKQATPRLEPKVFKSVSPKKMANHLKASAEKSKRRKGTPRHSAMSMINF